MSLTELSISERDLRARRGLKWNRYPPDVIPAWVADMDFRVAPAIVDVLRRGVDDHDFGYAIRNGVRADAMVGQAFAARMERRFGWRPEPDLVVPCHELVQAMNACVWAFSDRGEAVVVQTPCYPPFREAVTGLDRRFAPNPMVDDGSRYVLDVDHLDHLLRERPPLMFLCHPQNPTGRAFSRDELRQIAELALRHDVLVVSDEVHADFLYGASHTPFACAHPEIAARTITITSPTKTYNTASLRGAVMHFGTVELRDRLAERLPLKLLGTLGVVSVDTAVAAWADSDEWERAMLAQLTANRSAVHAAVASWPGITGHLPEATYLYWLDCRQLPTGGRSAAAFFLNEARVALNDGAEFITDGEGFARLNFATSPELLAKMLNRMTTAISTATS